MNIESSSFHKEMKEYITYLKKFNKGSDNVYNFSDPYLKPDFLTSLENAAIEDIVCEIGAGKSILEKTYKKFVYLKLNKNVDKDIQELLAPELLKGNKEDIIYWMDYLSDETLLFLYNNAEEIIKRQTKNSWDQPILKFHYALFKHKPELFKSYIQQEKSIDKKVTMMLIADEKVNKPEYINDILSLLDKIKGTELKSKALRYVEYTFLNTNDVDLKTKILTEVSALKLPGFDENSDILRSVRHRAIDDIVFKKKIDIEIKNFIFHYLKVDSTDIIRMLTKYAHELVPHKKTGVFSISDNFQQLLDFVEHYYKEDILKAPDLYIEAWAGYNESSYRAILYWLHHKTFSKGSVHTEFFKSALYERFPHASFNAKSKLVDSFKALEINLPIVELQKHLLDTINNVPVPQEINIVL